jgi:four helix bundle protein
LEIWKRSIKLVEEIYAATRNFPKEEMYGLASQVRRAAVSIPSNIAEGFSRASNREYKQFLFISLGSCAEVTTQTIISKNLNFVNAAKVEILLKETEEISKMIMSLKKN